MKNNSFQKKIFISHLIIGILPLLITIPLLFLTINQSITANFEKEHLKRMDNFQKKFAEVLNAGRLSIEKIAANRTIKESLVKENSDDTTGVYSAFYQAILNSGDNVIFSILNQKGESIYSSAGIESSLPDISDTNWGILKQAQKTDSLVLRNVNSYSQKQTQIVLQMAKCIKSENQIIGYIVMDIPYQVLDDIFKTTIQDNQAFVLVDSYWQKIYSPKNIISNHLYLDLREYIFSDSETINLDKSILFSQEMPEYSFSIFLKSEAPLTMWIKNLFSLLSSFIVIIVVILCLLASLSISKQISNPLRKLSYSMAQVEKGKWQARVEIKGHDEFSQLGNSFNQMIENLNEKIELLKENERELSQTKIRMLQAQLNPHFLYNTLDTIKWVGKLQQVPMVSSIATNLASILRTSISGPEFHTLREELELLERYIEIQNLRLSKGIKINLDIAENCLVNFVPKMILQPIAENSILHGFENQAEGVINIKACKINGTIEIFIEDNGIGFSQQAIDYFYQNRNKKNMEHFGLHNTDALLRLYFGKESGVKIYSQKSGAKIGILLPELKGEAE